MKRLILLLALTSVAFAAYPNLQLAYRFQNSALDWSGNGRDGTGGGGGYVVARGQQALYFYNSVDRVATPSFGLSGTVVVFACWTRNAFSSFLSQTFIGDGSSDLWCYRSQNGNDLNWTYTGWATATSTDYFADPYNDVWLFLCIVCDYAGKKTYFYRNSALVTTATMTGTPAAPTTAKVKYIGNYQTSGGSYYIRAGYLQNVQLWTLATMPPLAVMNASVARLALGLMPIW